MIFSTVTVALEIKHNFVEYSQTANIDIVVLRIYTFGKQYHTVSLQVIFQIYEFFDVNFAC